MLEVAIAEAVSGVETAEAAASSPAGTKGTSDETLVTDVLVDRERYPQGLVCQLPERASVNERLQVKSEKHKRMERCMTCICNRKKHAQRENDGWSCGSCTYLNVLSQYVSLSGWLLKQATCDWHVLGRNVALISRARCSLFVKADSTGTALLETKRILLSSLPNLLARTFLFFVSGARQNRTEKGCGRHGVMFQEELSRAWCGAQSDIISLLRITMLGFA